MNCYKVNATAPDFIGSVRGLRLNFASYLNETELPLEVTYHLTSEDNAYSVTFDKRMNGNVLKHQGKMGHWALLSIKAEKFIYLKEASGCIDLSFWEMWEPAYSTYSGFDKCPKKCAAISLPNNRYKSKQKINSYVPLFIKSVDCSTTICQKNEEYICAWNQITPSFDQFIMKGYPKTCTILQYSGEVEFDANLTHLDPPLYGTHQVYLGYNFAPPRTVTIHEEYLIYDAIGLVGCIGGTLGMFIGFSFSSTIGALMQKINYFE